MTYKIILLMWQFGVIDRFTVVNFLYNADAQYGAIVVDGNMTQLPLSLLQLKLKLQKQRTLTK